MESLILSRDGRLFRNSKEAKDSGKEYLEFIRIPDKGITVKYNEREMYYWYKYINLPGIFLKINSNLEKFRDFNGNILESFNNIYNTGIDFILSKPILHYDQMSDILRRTFFSYKVKSILKFIELFSLDGLELLHEKSNSNLEFERFKNGKSVTINFSVEGNNYTLIESDTSDSSGTYYSMQNDKYLFSIGEESGGSIENYYSKLSVLYNFKIDSKIKNYILIEIDLLHGCLDIKLGEDEQYYPALMYSLDLEFRDYREILFVFEMFVRDLFNTDRLRHNDHLCW